MLVRGVGIRYDHIATDNWNSFANVFSRDSHQRGKFFTKGIEGNNCTLRHRKRLFFRKTCCFSKRADCHFIIFAAVRYYINSGEFPSAGVHITSVLNRKNGFAAGKIGAKVAVAQSHGEQLL